MIVLSVVFSNIFKFDISNYPVYILTGQVIFNFFSEATNASMTSIIENGQLIKKIYVPKYMFTFSAIISSAINVLASFAALIFIMVFMRCELYFTMLLSFIPVLLVALFATGVGFFLAAFAVKFRDIVHFYGVFLTALMYLMPVIYPISIVENVPVVSKIVAYNPLTVILNGFRDLTMNGCLPDWASLGIVFLVSIAILIIGLLVFYRRQDKFILDL